jgi:hypothetical protein
MHRRCDCLIHLGHPVNHIDGVIPILLESKRDFFIDLVQLINFTLFCRILTGSKVFLAAFTSLCCRYILTDVRSRFV